MSYKLFLDDIRTVDMVYPSTDHFFVIVRSYDACISYIKENGLPEFMSFDNDLGEDVKTKSFYLTGMPLQNGLCVKVG